MKYTSLIIGIILFSGVAYALFFAAGTIGESYESKDYITYQRLANTYVNDTELGTQENGTLQKIKVKLDNAEFSIVSAAVGAIDSVLQGAKLMLDSMTTVKRIGHQVQEDTTDYIPNIVFTIINSIIAVVIIIIILIVFIKMKPET